MLGMEIDSPPKGDVLSPQDRIVQRLASIGVPEEILKQLQPGLVAYVQNNRFRIPTVVSAIFPTDEEAIEAVSEAQSESTTYVATPSLEDHFNESISWLQWLMFEGEPLCALKHLAKLNVGQRGVCGAVWGNNDIAYRCRTCEHDPTCAICVPCFQNGNHKDHDYSIIYTGGGCCDCGDVTAWKREGFCSKHKGAEQIQPLSEEFVNSVGPVLDSLLPYWKNKLLFAEAPSQSIPRTDFHVDELKQVSDELTSAVVKMLLEFCNYSESLLSFVSGRLCSSVGLLDILVRAERFVSENVAKKLHELLLKLLGEPLFKYEFAKVFLNYYPTVIDEAVKECNDTVFKKYQLLSTFSVQIFTVPTLTPRLVKEMDLLSMLLECLGDVFISCAGDDGRLQVVKWGNLYETTLRVVEDIRFVTSHSVVPKYVTRDRRDILRTWMRLLAFVQGMNPQKRETGIHIEEENENMHLPFVLGHSIANIHSLLVAGAFLVGSDEETDDGTFSNTYKQDFEDQDRLRHAKVGRVSQESSVSSVMGRCSSMDSASRAPEIKSDIFPIPSSVLWLTYECLRAIESWLGVDNTSGPLLSVLSPQKNNITGNNFFALKRTLSKIRKGRYIFKSNHSLSSSNKNASSSEGHGRNSSSPSQSGFSTDFESGRSMGQALSPTAVDDVAMDGEYANDLEALRVLSLSDWPDIAHDVSSHDISVHIPLHRLISLVLQKALRRCYGESALPSFSNASFADPSSTIYNEFLGHVLGGCHPYGFSAFVMEHPLRIRVFCAEVHAGMWRKNGDAAILSCEWYRSVRWSEQGLELDLFLLQCCAALAPPDLYVKRILERFGLSSYLNLNLERSSEYEPVLVNEMLTLIIQIVKERRFCGLTTAECLKRELIYKLSIGDATRSQLVKSLPRDLSKLDQLQEVLDAIAVYSNPSGMNQGMYKLRLQCWKELDLYHPRWNSRDLQVAEERYMRFCNVSALTTQLPKWSKIYHPLSAIARIATCKSVLQIVRAVLFYAVFNDDWTASRAPDVVLLTALHLLSLALDICFTQKEPAERSVIPILAYADEVCVNSRYGDQSLLSLLVALMRKHKKENPENFIEAGSFNLASLIENLLKKFAELDSRCFIQLQKDAPEVVNQLLQSIADDNTNVMGSVMEGERRKAKARERQAAILEKMRAQQSKFLESINPDADDGLNGPKTGQEVSSSDDGNDSNESAQVVCSLCHDPKSNNAVSFLVLLQKSRLLSFVDRGPLSWEQVRRSGKEPVVTNTNTVDVPTRFPQARNILLPRTSNNAREKSTCSLETLEDHMYMLIQEGMHNASVHLDTLTENENLSTAQGVPTRSGESDSLLLGKYISALSKETLDSPSVSESTRSHSDRTHSESTKLPTENEAFGPPDCDGIHISSCGHAVHQGCLDRYLSSLKERYIRRIVFEGGQIVDPDQGEFLCPVCRGLANSVLPALPGDSKKAGQLQLTPIIRWPDSADALSFSNRAIDPLRLRHALSLFQSAAEVAGREEILRLLPIQLSGRMRTSLDSIFRLLCGLYFPGKDKVTGSGRVTHPMILWDTLRYSLVSTEIAARSRRTSLAPEYSFVAIFKELKSSSGFILSLLHKIVQSTKNKSTVSAILRLRGTQIFAESICSGVTVDELPTSTSRQRGEMLFILDDADDDVRYPDMQFWKWASHPILARDAFSSLMWVLFCLPSQFLSCEESFLSLVHIFYAVSIAQAIITYCRKHQGDMTEISYHDCLITDISKIIGESGVAQYFVSNYFDPACDIKDTIRSLTFPFLRRCALLWKLINSSSSAPFHDGAQVLDRLSSHGDDDKMECTSTLPELVEVEELEKMFSIPPLDVVINDQTLRSLVRKWLNHLSNECEVRRLKFVMHSTPAAPFKLMILPDIYQDLLQRYIKQCCPDCGVIQEEPALCLLCGKVCSPHWKPCCRESGCQSHALACGAGTGVFLLIRRTTILLQRSARQAPWPSPYLDAFGEEDIEMHRGKPLYLNEERYAALTHMVASHGLDRSSKVLRQTTIASFFML